MKSSEKKILIVEDELDLLKIFEETLTEFGFITTTATSLEEARLQLNEQKFVILMTDFRLHEKQISSLIFDPEMLRRLPPAIVIVTAYPDAISFPKEIPSKIYVLEKPVRLDTLPIVLNEVLNNLKV